MFSGFKSLDVPLDGAVIHARIGGQGPPVLLLHGYPQTHAMWHAVAPTLALTHGVVLADLRGYGASRALTPDFTFRAMARDMVALMAHLGHARFHLVAHDRGARTAHRLVLDHPQAALSLMLLDILPTLDVWRTMDDCLARRYWHWLFLAQPGDMPRRLICADPVAFVHAALVGLSGDLNAFHPKALAAYEQAARNPDVVAAWCADYAAAATTDLDHDRADLGRRIDLPMRILWGSRGAVAHHLDPVTAWRAWFPAATGRALDAGHFLPEECPDAVLAEITAHLGV